MDFSSVKEFCHRKYKRRFPDGRGLDLPLRVARSHFDVDLSTHSDYRKHTVVD